MPRYHKNPQYLANELYKIRNGLSANLVKKLFTPNTEHPYNLRHLHQFKMPSVNTVYHDTESICFLGPKIWDILPESFKKMKNVEAFKRAIKTWKPKTCPCRLCEAFVKNICFLRNKLEL